MAASFIVAQVQQRLLYLKQPQFTGYANAEPSGLVEHISLPFMSQALHWQGREHQSSPLSDTTIVLYFLMHGPCLAQLSHILVIVCA